MHYAVKYRLRTCWIKNFDTLEQAAEFADSLQYIGGDLIWVIRL